MTLFGAAISLFVVYNVLGNIPFYIAVLKPYTPKRQKFILIREMLIALSILFAFGFFGDEILKFLGITGGIISIAGGILLLLISLTMIFPKHSNTALPEHEPLIVPLAMPTMAGPGSIAAVMLYSHTFDSSLTVATIIFLAWIPSLLILLAASNIKYLVGDKGLMAFERFGGLLISLVAVKMLTTGVITLVKENFDVSATHKTHSAIEIPK